MLACFVAPAPTSSSAAAPQVSVCIPTYNYGHFLGAAIESVLDQDFAEFELVVVDNASDDDTTAVVERYRDPRLRFHRNDRNVGLFGNFARCLELSTGELVKFLAADDWLHPAYLREAVALMRRHPSAAIVSCPGFFVDAHGAPYAVGTGGVFADELVPGAVALRAQAEFLNVIGMPSNVLLRRDALDAVGGFDGRFAPAADVHLWGKLLARHDLGWLTQPRCYLRIHSTKAHDYGLDPSESTFLAWEDLGEDVGPPITPELVRLALDAEAERSLLYVVAHLLAGRPQAARQILSFTSRHVSVRRALGRFGRRLPVLARAQLARVLAVRGGRMVVYDPLARLGAPLSRADDALPDS
jgi:glycosyltransferase involved in cell wall biosynthesis